MIVNSVYDVSMGGQVNLNEVVNDNNICVGRLKAIDNESVNTLDRVDPCPTSVVRQVDRVDHPIRNSGCMVGRVDHECRALGDGCSRGDTDNRVVNNCSLVKCFIESDTGGRLNNSVSFVLCSDGNLQFENHNGNCLPCLFQSNCQVDSLITNVEALSEFYYPKCAYIPRQVGQKVSCVQRQPKCTKMPEAFSHWQYSSYE